MPNTDSPSSGSNALTLLRDDTVIAFLKFCTVGLSNIVLDGGTAYVLIYHFGIERHEARVISFIVSVSNSFYWNRRWTFNAAGQSDVQRRYILFFVINVIGWLLNMSIQEAFIRLSHQNPHQVSKPLWVTSYLIAAAICVFWNFFASKRWSFNK